MYYQDTLFKILAFLQCCLLITAQQNVTCFYPNGTDLSPKTDVYDFFQQCPTSLNNDDVYMCCKKSDPFDDVCQPNGLCARSSNRPLGLVQGLLRIGCTDPSYTSPSCLKLCDTGIDYNGDWANGTDQFVTKCDDSSYCCGNKGDNSTTNAAIDACCSSGHGMFILPNGTVSEVNPSASASHSNSLTSSPTSAGGSAQVSSPTPAPPSSPHTGAIAGGVVGGVVGLALLVGILFVFFLRRQKMRGSAGGDQSYVGGGPASLEKSGTVYARSGMGKHELDADGRPLEKDGNERFEKDGLLAGEGGGHGPYEVPAEYPSR